MQKGNNPRVIGVAKNKWKINLGAHILNKYADLTNPDYLFTQTHHKYHSTLPSKRNNNSIFSLNHLNFLDEDIQSGEYFLHFSARKRQGLVNALTHRNKRSLSFNFDGSRQSSGYNTIQTPTKNSFRQYQFPLKDQLPIKPKTATNVKRSKFMNQKPLKRHQSELASPQKLTRKIGTATIPIHKDFLFMQAGKIRYFSKENKAKPVTRSRTRRKMSTPKIELKQDISESQRLGPGPWERNNNPQGNNEEEITILTNKLKNK